MIRIEISLRLPNTPGALAGVTRLLSDEHINVLAMSLGSGGELRLLTTLAHFGTAIDVTLAELTLEAFLPADEATAAALATV